MLATVKIIHFLSFAIGIGGGVANMVIAMRAASVDAAMQMPLRAVQTTLGRLSFGTLILLWLTGVYMIYAANGGWAGLGTVFWMKIAAVLVLTAASFTMQYMVLTAARREPAMLARRMPQLGMTATGAAVAALALAVFAFG